MARTHEIPQSFVSASLPEKDKREVLDSALYFGIDLTIQQFASLSIQQSTQEASVPQSAHAFTIPENPKLPVIAEPKVDSEVVLPEPIIPLNIPSDIPMGGALPEEAKKDISYLDRSIEDLNNDLIMLKEGYDGLMDPWKGLSYHQKHFIYFGKYAHANRDNLNHGIKLFFNSPQSERFENMLHGMDNAYYKFAIPAVGLFVNIFKSLFNNAYKPQLASLKKRFYKLEAEVKETNFRTKTLLDPSTIHGNSDNSIEHLKTRLDNISAEILKIEREVASTTPTNLLKCAASVIPLALIATFATLSKKCTNKLCKEVSDIIRCSFEASNIYEAFSTQSEWLHHLRPKICINKIQSDKSVKRNQNKLQKNLREFLQSLEQCKKMHEVKALLSHHQISIEIPELRSEWKMQFKKISYKQEIIQAYYHSNGLQAFMTPENCKSLLDKRQAEFSQKVDENLKAIKAHIQECKHKTTLEEISQYFAQLHIDLQLANPPLKNIEDWNQQIDELNFQKSLSKQWVAHEETIAQFSEQSLRALLICQNTREYKFLVFSMVESSVQIAASFVKCISLGMGMGLKLYPSIEKCVKLFSVGLIDLSDAYPLIGLSTLIFPGWTSKVISLILAGAQLAFGYYYKTNEYSCEGYKIYLERLSLNFVSKLYSLISYLEKALLWVNIHLIENFVLQIDSVPFESDPRYIQLNEKLKELHNDCELQKKILQSHLNKMCSMDNNINFFPDAGTEDKEVEAAVGFTYMNEKTLHCRALDPVETLIDHLMHANFDFWPVSTRQFMEGQLGVQFKNANKEQIKQSIRSLFLSDEIDFVRSSKVNRAAFLKI